MAKSEADAKKASSATRILALIMGVSLLLIGAAGLVVHLTHSFEWLLGEHLVTDVFHLVMGVLALGAGGSERSSKGYGRFALLVFLVATVLAAVGPVLAHHEHVSGVPAWLAENQLGFSELNYILYFLMMLWGLQLSKTDPAIDPWGSGDSHATLRAMPDREDAIAEKRQPALTPSAE